MGEYLLEHSLVVVFALLVAPIMTVVYALTDYNLDLEEKLYGFNDCTVYYWVSYNFNRFWCVVKGVSV